MLRHGPLLRNGAVAVAAMLLVWISVAAWVDAAPPIWLPSGLACALAVRRGWSVMPGLWLGSVLGALQVQAMPGAFALRSLMSLEPLLVLLLAARWGPRRDVFHASRSWRCSCSPAGAETLRSAETRLAIPHGGGGSEADGVRRRRECAASSWPPGWALITLL
jgi:hypothetical protein